MPFRSAHRHFLGRLICDVRPKEKLTKLALKLFITDEGYRAIGHVAAQWSFLEIELDNLLRIFLGQEEVKKLKLENTQSFKSRMSNLKKASKVLLTKGSAELIEITDIIEKTSSLRGFRDDIIHGQWKLHRKVPALYPGIIYIKSFP